jgi:hypothetical protein
MKLIDKQNNYYDFLVHWNHFNSSVISFLSNTPLIFRDSRGLSGVYVIDSDKSATQTEAWKAYQSNWIPGLQRLYLIATSGWQEDIKGPAHTRLISLNPIENLNPRTLLKRDNQHTRLE